MYNESKRFIDADHTKDVTSYIKVTVITKIQICMQQGLIKI